MLVWNHQLTLPTTASAEAIWRAWSDPSTWPQWDAGLDRVILNGPFVSGTTGTLTPKGGPTVRFQLVTVTPERLSRPFILTTDHAGFHSHL